ncbi:hypothetical protein [Micromonospora sp. WMMD812]|uniref:hypothetical protein n=1 Tax=Micromonospora sp. WMMD812 TaxID=3015152 RepID=UPI00248B7A6D|nr:hypothetical protein [Micromonospora sp. WMMD812]WBB64978.1 hypothetical protein O7603_17265 [Micromonospora sp. WMMD812]
MNIRRWSVGVVAATLFIPAMAACNSKTDEPAAGGSPAAAVPADPKEALLASTKELEKGNFTFTLAGDGMTGQGLVHKPSNSAQVTMTMDDGSGTSMGMELIYIEPESWVKLDLGELGDMIPGAAATKDKYQHLDQSKVKDAEALSLNMQDVDPGDSATLLKGISDVQKTGEGAYGGKLDASAVTDSDALDADQVKALGAQAKALPFTAKLDAQGRLTELVISVPAAGETKAHDIKVTYADYGSATAAQKPPADKVVEASEQTYEMFK